MKQITSIRINSDILNHLRNLNINVSDYVNELMIDDLKKQSMSDTILKKVVESAINDEKKTILIQELKLIGAINNIEERIKSLSKGDEISIHILIKKNIDLIEIEFNNNNYSKDTKDLIKATYKKLYVALRQIEPRAKEQKLINKNEIKKIKSV